MLHLINPAQLSNPTWNYGVLAFAFVFESYSFAVAFRAFEREKGPKVSGSRFTAANPTTFYTVLFEDAAALLGLIVAFAGVFMAHSLNNPYFDGAASIVIGLILAVVAVVLAYESKGLLVGEAADPETLKDIRRLAEADPYVEGVNRALTTHFGPETILLLWICASEKLFQQRK